MHQVQQGKSGIDLFAPVRLGPYDLRNRMVMAPMTRNRAGVGNVPHELNAVYYGQRASAGLIVSEASQVSPQGVGYPGTPGIHSREQVEGWKLVTKAVHERGGRIFLQLWHVGRISHPSLQPDGELPVAPSSIRPTGDAFTATGLQPFVTPRALETHEISGIVEQYRRGAINALAAGFDGVEIHAANGYLIDQFLRDGANRRTDRYGGPLENRMRLLQEVTGVAVDVWGGNRVGVRLSPVSPFNDMIDSNPQHTFEHAVAALNRFGLAYAHVVETGIETQPRFDFASLRKAFRGAYIANAGYTKERAHAALADNDADLVSFGVLFLANPDLPVRFGRGAPLNTPDQSAFYGGSEKGYTDYPFLDAQSE